MCHCAFVRTLKAKSVKTTRQACYELVEAKTGHSSSTARLKTKDEGKASWPFKGNLGYLRACLYNRALSSPTWFLQDLGLIPIRPIIHRGLRATRLQGRVRTTG